MNAFLLALSLLCAPPDPAAFYADLFAKRLKAEEAFTAEFLRAVPAEKIAQIAAIYAESVGAFERAQVKDGAGTLFFAQGTCSTRIGFDGAGRVSALWFGPPERSSDSPADILAAFAALPGTAAVVLRRDGKEVCARNGDLPLAVGSSFKLYLLKALAKAQAEGLLPDDHVVPLEAPLVSLPTGILQEWPAGTPLTVRALAHLMVSISDNTATDTLLSLLGRPRVEAEAPARMRPLLSTREMFLLKLGKEADGLRAKYLAADEAGRRALLDSLAGRLPALGDAMKWENPVAVDSVEWFATANELCDAIASLEGDPSLRINPGLVKKADWHAVAYKGGSEPGVLNYTLLLRKREGSPLFALSATINDAAAPVAADRFNAAVLRLVDLAGSGALDR